MIPTIYLPPEMNGHKTWRATLPAFDLREMTDNLLYGDREISDAIGCYLDETAVMKRVDAGDLQAPEAADLAHSPSPQAEAERTVAWLYQHADTWQRGGLPLRFSQSRLLQDNMTLYLTDGHINHLAHLRLAAAIMKRSLLDIEVVFGARKSMLWLISGIPSESIHHDPAPRSALFGEAFFPLGDTLYEGVFVRPDKGIGNHPMCTLEDYRSRQVVGRYSLDGWDVGFNDPLSRPASEMGAKLPGGPDSPLTLHLRDEEGCTESHLSNFCDESERFLGSTTSGLREYLMRLLALA